MSGNIRRPALRYFGGKWKLAPWIVSHMPAHDVYVEPFGGAASVLLRKPRVRAEIYNDLDGEIVNFFQVIRDRSAELYRATALTPYARAEFDLSTAPSEDPLEQARRTAVRSYMGFGGNLTRLTVGNRLERTGFRDYSKKDRRSIPAQDWRTWPEVIFDISRRLRGVIIERRPALDVMTKHDCVAALHYVDPPYVAVTRDSGRSNGKRGYRHELSDDQHRELRGRIEELAGAVIVSGYRSALYDELYAGWNCVARAAMADGARERVECLWLSPGISTGDLFAESLRLTTENADNPQRG